MRRPGNLKAQVAGLLFGVWLLGPGCGERRVADQGGAGGHGGRGLVGSDGGGAAGQSPKALSFLAGASYGVGAVPYSIAVGDLNGDGKPDLVVASRSGNPDVNVNVNVLLNNGNGTFAAAANYAAGPNSNSIAIGDLNADGSADLAVAYGDASSGNVSVLANKGNGMFAAAVNTAAGANPDSVAIGDLNGDGKPDLVVAHDSGSVATENVVVLFNNGNGSFAAPVTYAAGPRAVSVALGDLDGDGKADIAVANFVVSGSVSVLLNNGDGTFAAAASYAAGTLPLSVGLGDLNGDGRADLVATNITGGSNDDGNVSVLLNVGNGAFAAPVNYAASKIPLSAAIGDLNGDGKADLAVAHGGSGDLSVLLNNGTGTFGESHQHHRRRAGQSGRDRGLERRWHGGHGGCERQHHVERKCHRAPERLPLTRHRVASHRIERPAQLAGWGRDRMKAGLSQGLSPGRVRG